MTAPRSHCKQLALMLQAVQRKREDVADTVHTQVMECKVYNDSILCTDRD